MNTITQSDIELSERLRRACLEKGILEPRFVAQDADGEWWHFESRPIAMAAIWENSHGNNGHGTSFLFFDRTRINWHETLMEWNPKAGVPLSGILQNTCEHCGKMLANCGKIE